MWQPTATAMQRRRPRVWLSLVAMLLSPYHFQPAFAAASLPGAGTPPVDATVDEPAIVALEQATTRQAQSMAVANIKEALEHARLSAQQMERIATVLASTVNRSDNPNQAQPAPGLIQLLQSQPVRMSARTITLLAETLASDTILNMSRAADIAMLIGEQLSQQPLPSTALTTLRSTLDHVAMSNRMAAIDALSSMPTQDRRYANVVEELTFVLSRNDHHHTRLTVLRAFARMSETQPLTPKALSTVAKIAGNDPYLTVRLEALELMLTQSPPPRKPSAGNRQLVRELLQPTQELWQKSAGTREHKDIRARAIAYLKAWYEPKYPADVLQVFINECKSHAPQQSLDILRKVRLRDGLSDAQLFELRSIAAEHSQPKWRDAIYQLALPNLVQGSVVDAEQTFVHSGNINARLEAGHALLRHYGGKPIPERIAMLASAVVVDFKDHRLLEVAAKLIAQSELPKADKEPILLEALRQKPNTRELPEIILSLYSPRDIDAFAQNHIEDSSLPTGFRSGLLRQVGDNVGQPMSPELITALRNTAESASTTYYLIGSIHSAMTARGAAIPMIVTLKSRSFQSGALSVVWMISLITTLIIGVGAFIGALNLPFNGSTLGVKRGMLIAGWLAATVVMLGVLAIGFVGFLGHNSAPAPSSTLMFNLPLYAALFIYVPLGVVLMRRGWRNRKSVVIRK